MYDCAPCMHRLAHASLMNLNMQIISAAQAAAAFDRAALHKDGAAAKLNFSVERYEPSAHLLAGRACDDRACCVAAVSLQRLLHQNDCP